MKPTQYTEQIIYAADRPGHDKQYAIDSTKINQKLNWAHEETLEAGLRKIFRWYLDNQEDDINNL